LFFIGKELVKTFTKKQNGAQTVRNSNFWFAHRFMICLQKNNFMAKNE